MGKKTISDDIRGRRSVERRELHDQPTHMTIFVGGGVWSNANYTISPPI